MDTDRDDDAVDAAGREHLAAGRQTTVVVFAAFGVRACLSVCGAELVVVVMVVVIVVVVVVAMFLQIRGITSVKLMMDGIDVTRNRCRRVSYRTWVPFLPASAEPVVVCFSLPCAPGALAS